MRVTDRFRFDMFQSNLNKTRKNIDDVARRILGVGLDAIERVFR